MYTIGAPLIPFNSATPGVCPTDGSIHPSQDFATTDINTKLNQWEMTDDTQQPPLDRGCYLIGDLNSANLCPTATGTTLLPPIPNGPNNPKHIGDLLDPLGVSWCHYSENFTTAEVDCSAGSTVSYKPTGWNPHMQPFNHFSTFSSQTSSYWTTHQKDALTDFFPALNSGKLENVTWYRPTSFYCYGFGNNSPRDAAGWMDQFVSQVQASSLWQQKRLAVIFTFANANGLFDHVPPYVGDNYGPGLRVPTILMSPYHVVGSTASQAVDSTPLEHYSIIKMLARRFGVQQSALQAMWGNTRYMAAGDMTQAFKGNGNGASHLAAPSALFAALVALLAVVMVL